MPPAQNSGKRILQNSSWILSSKIVSAVLSIVYLALIARALEPERFGMFMLIFSFAQLVAGLVAFQTWQIIVRYGTAYVLKGVSDKFAQLVWICLALDGLGLLTGLVLVLAGGHAIAFYFGWNAELHDTVLLFSAIFLLSARATPLGILRVHDRYRDAAFCDTLVPVIRFAGVLAALVWSPTLKTFLFVWALSEIVPTIVLWLIIFRTIHLPMTSQSPLRVLTYARDYPDLLRFATFSNLGSSLRLAGQQGVVLAVGFSSGVTAAGFFRLGHQLGQVLARVADTLSYTIFTEFNRITHDSGSAAAASLIARSLKLTAISALLIFSLLIAIGKWLIIAIFGPEFAPAYPFLLLLGGAAAVQVGTAALEPALLSRGLAGWVLLANLTGTICLGVAFVVLVPQFSAFGAAIAVLVGAIIYVITLSLIYRRFAKDAVKLDSIDS